MDFGTDKKKYDVVCMDGRFWDAGKQSLNPLSGQG